ncbi:MAG: hypothetical protein IT249_19825 [Chitinophagaceae bacterium]|nr:hypothetical protein [Chitinophagaceae bacterium]
MKKRKSSVLLLATIILLILALHYKLHSSERVSAEDQNKEIQTKNDVDSDRPIFPATIYRLVEIAL